MKQLVSIVKAVADENRLRILRALREGELCVCQIVELLEVSAPTVSRHLSILESAGLVTSNKDGRWVHYRLPEDAGPDVERTLAWLRAMFAAANNDDAKHLAAIRQVGAEEICRRQREN